MNTVSEQDSLLVLAEAGAGKYGSAMNANDQVVPHFYEQESSSYALHSISKLWEAGYMPSKQIAQLIPESVQAYQEKQNELLRSYALAATQHPKPYLTRQDWDFLQNHREEFMPGRGKESEKEKKIRRAIFASNICNAILVIAQLYAFITSSSLSLLAVFLDAVLDMVAGLVVLFTFIMRQRKDSFRYPVGRSRLEPLGVIGMACLMTAATLVTLEQSITALVVHETGFSGLTVVAASILLTALAVKFSLLQYCKRIDDPSVQALAADHLNDCLSNSLGICTALIAQQAIWWVDPVGGILISLIIIRNWGLHTLEHCDQLLGKVARNEIANVVTFMACNHHPDITMIDTVTAYHVGVRIYVEVHIVLAADMPLHQAHDIGESLQIRIETLDDVERCFIHIDTEVYHSKSSEHIPL